MLAAIILAAVIVAVVESSRAPRSPRPPSAPVASARPNIVFVLTDDLSWDLLAYMPRVRALQRLGLTFRDYFVSDSLCCPSRSSIFTGNFPHDTGVFSNVGPHGGFHVFHSRGEEKHTFAVALQRVGYRTALMGKYLNGYLARPAPGEPRVVAPTYVPPGWSEWDVAGDGYHEFNYELNENGVLHHYGKQPSDYLTDVLARLGAGFIDRSAAAHAPFFLELATFAPHAPYTPAPRDARDFPGLRAPEPPNFDVLPTNAPEWLKEHPPLTGRQIARINRVFQLRAQAVQAVDDLIARIEHVLAVDGIAGNTYIFFSSDNGLHTGEYRLMPGKMTAFDTDIGVPLVVVGPGVSKGAVSDRMTENIDLAETFAQLGGTSVTADGHSLVSLIHGETVRHWPNAILVEHHGPDLRGIDPDFQQPASGNPETYEAMRTHSFLYVEYRDGEREYYDLLQDPYELHNIAGMLSAGRLAKLHAELRAMENCHGAPACWRAMHVGAGG